MGLLHHSNGHSVTAIRQQGNIHKINTMFISIGFHIRGQGMGWDWDGIDYDPAAVVLEHAFTAT